MPRTPLGLAFASEIKALLALTGLRRQVNPQRLYDYLTTGLTDHGRETMFADIHQVPAAHYLEIGLDAPAAAVEPDSLLEYRPSGSLDISYAEATARVRELFLQSVKLHLRSDVPVGAALSGGIDSSSIVGAMRHAGAWAGIARLQLHRRGPELSEEKWVDLAAAQAGAVLHKVHAHPGRAG